MVAVPDIPDELPDDYDHSGEGNPKSRPHAPVAPCNTWALCQVELVLYTTHRKPPSSEAGLPFSEVVATRPRSYRSRQVTSES